MSILKKNSKEAELKKEERRRQYIEGMRSLQDNGFLAKKKAGDEIVSAEATFIRTHLFPEQVLVLEGSILEQKEKIRRFIKEYIYNYLLIPRRGKSYNYDLEALMDIIGFVMENRNPAYEALLAIIPEGIEITVPAALPENRGSVPGLEGLENAAKRCFENKNGYPVISYDADDGKLTAAVFVPPYFYQPFEVRSNAAFANMMNAASDPYSNFTMPYGMGTLRPMGNMNLKYLKKEKK